MNKRLKTRPIKIGKVSIGANFPIAIQSMTKVDTCNIQKTVNEIRRLEKAGCEIIRVAVRDIKAARAINAIKKKIKIPLVADIHFDYKLALAALENGADKIRINPGNISKESDLKEIIECAKKRKVPIRIGINSGSARLKSFPDRAIKLVSLARKYIKFFERQNFRDIIISLKSSSVRETVDAYRKLSKVCSYPLHLGVTSAGSLDTGIVKSSIGIGSLLLDGIGDTIRVSLTGDSVFEVIAAKRILQALKLRNFGPEVISCPTCGRCQVDLLHTVKHLEAALGRDYLLATRTSSRFTLHASRFTRPITIAVMGCEVNGPGEAKDADLGVAFGKDSGVLFKKGQVVKKVKSKDAAKELMRLLKEI
ncbi:MAG: flavodoxin-dependent (E)-4-hydroxy-3-methylbut-2-enyl-diphosphate synthase [Candidatus Omnitrophota bacterium]